jgi:predicted secreted protein
MMMKRIASRALAGLLTFVVGVGIAAAFVRTHRPEHARQTAPTLPRVEAPDDDGRVLELVFVLDTTGSMGGLLEGAKQKIWGLVNEVMQAPSAPAVRVGLVAYRDNEDEYVTQILPLTSDLDRVYTTLMEYRAGGGGDWPENVRRALADGVGKAGWSQPSGRIAQVIFLVGDAPPQDYKDEPAVLDTVKLAVTRGMTVNAIQCGEAADTRRVWEEIARGGEGRYFSIAQDGGVRAVSSPYDERLSELAARLGSTHTPYGGGAGPAGTTYRREMAAAQAAAESHITAGAELSARADRAVNKVLNKNAYAGDLLQAIENGSVKLSEVRTEDLPDDLQKLSPAAREQEVARRLAERRKIREEITTLSRQRDAHVAAERKKTPGAGSGFDAAVAAALREQLSRKGFK